MYSCHCWLQSRNGDQRRAARPFKNFSVVHPYLLVTRYCIILEIISVDPKQLRADLFKSQAVGDI